MATKKKTEDVIVEQEAAAVPEVPKEPEKPKMVKLMVPSDPLCEDSDSIFVSVNGMNFQIKRGAEVEVPEFVAEVYQRSVESDVKAQEAARKLRAKMAARKAI